MGDRVGPFFLHRLPAEHVTREEMRRAGGGGTATSILSFGRDGGVGGHA